MLDSIPDPPVCGSQSLGAPVIVLATVVVGSVAWLAVDVILEKRGTRWLATMLGAMLFGWFVEWANITSLFGGTSIYCYPTYPLPWLLAPGGVPIWVPIGWGGIIYAATWTAQRLQLPPLLRPGAAAFLAASIDFSLDPVAKQAGLWNWSYFKVSFIGIPYDNYIGWYLVVLVYAASAAVVLRKTKDRWDVPDARTFSAEWNRSQRFQWGAPLLCAGLATLVYAGFRTLMDRWSGYKHDDGHVAGGIFVGATTLGALITIALSRPPLVEDDPIFSYPVMIVPALIHVACGVVFLCCLPWVEAPMLLAAIPLHMLAGLFIFTAPWLRTLRRATASAAGSPVQAPPAGQP